MITLKEIAQICGVSSAAVSKALNGRSDIGKETARRIRDVAQQMGYLPNASARTLKTKRSQNIGVLFVDTSRSGLKHEYFSAILDSLKIEAERSGYDVTFISRNIGNLTMSYYEHARYRSCDGVVIASVDFQDPDVIELVKSEIPTVTLDYVFEGHSAILSDNAGGMASIVEHLYSMGHRNIGFIHGEDTEVTRKRLRSFQGTCNNLGINVQPEWLRTALYHNPERSISEARAVLSLKDRPTCLIFPDDFSFIGSINDIESMGFSIPGDISIAAYDGINLSQLIRPRLTTYKQNAESLGREAAAKLINQIENPDFKPCTIEISGSLLIGDTVKTI